MARRSWLLAGAIVSSLAACGERTPAEPPPRPVLVAHPAASGAGVAAFAGEVRAREESPLAFRVGGMLVRRAVDVGARVERGVLLAELDPGDFALEAGAAQARLAAAEAELVRARADRARYAALAEDQLVSRSTRDAQEATYQAAAGQARAARAQLDVARNQSGYATLRAPAAGVIASRQAEAGQVVAAGQTVFTLAGDGGREVAIALPESRIRDFTIGQPVKVELWSAPGVRLDGTIREIAPAADAQARTYAARVALDADAAGRVDLGQSARVFVRAAGAVPLSVPLPAVQRGADGTASVWVVDGDARLKAVPVELGPFGSERVPVLAGLSADDWVVVAGGHLLREGQAVAPVDSDNRPVNPSP
ncbi:MULTISPECIES: efflux RND transporter periplasmic adaptor subunit [unclassified Luteimonas]|uniref:efflux RND transporter periplasmic adaptor subunit n=1 Tax=unclassified Luteimonas TaxID=2629088 RepID=UPI00160136A6|nr:MULTISPECIES: efflux RND transporter periplasmic adaptor subunit [unclassified Luteimonas]MBB1473646.1 efflux RND transporter periplasmic adaptor subunit [Luteimonas sp. MC1782]MBB6600139.1 efflux RND transporter periplasmic adaptor subunit [Luteimonas sp. MC1825]QOC87831.1 efflux RND transporter periplasmic adaptor subunit [Luteimonas sp. MC1825]